MQFVLIIHSLLRWLILLFALLTIISAASGMGGKKAFTKGDKRNALFLMICCDIQLLAGFALYFANGWFRMLSDSSVMKNAALRFFVMEHNVMMLIAIILVHIGYSATKRNISDGAKYKRLFWFTTIAMLIILVSIPWPNKPAGIARPLFRTA